MQNTTLILLLLTLMAIAYQVGLRRSRGVAVNQDSVKPLHSLPQYHGLFTALWCGLPSLAVLFLWGSLQTSVVTDLMIADLPVDMQSLNEADLGLVVNDIRNLAEGNIVSGEVGYDLQKAADHYLSLQQTAQAALAVVVLSLALLGTAVGWRFIAPRFRARNRVEGAIKWLLICCSTVAIFTTIGIVLSVLFESIRFFGKVPVSEFLFGLEWSPQMAIREDQVGSSGAFGAIPLFAGTLLIAFIAMLVATPIGLMSAIYLSEYANTKVRAIAKPMLEILAGIPTVVYGFFAALTVGPMIRELGTFLDLESMGLNVSSESALAAGLVMGIMIIPFISSLSDDAINAVPQVMRDASYGVGATRSETVRQVILPAALPGIVGGVLLAISRAIGETMIVVMAAGLSANLTANPFESVTTVTVQIVTLLVGDQEFDSAKTLAAFALGLMLFAVTLILNFIALYIVRNYREAYE
ncbi:MAG: phosphate ABC transporter permease subunit PstC [Sedimenticola sp.]